MEFLSNKINVSNILRKYHYSLRNPSTKLLESAEIFTFYILPIITAAILVWSLDGQVITSKNIIYFATPLSILIGFLMNVNGLLMNLVKNESKFQTKRMSELRTSVINNSFHAVSFTTLIGIITLASLPLVLIDTSGIHLHFYHAIIFEKIVFFFSSILNLILLALITSLIINAVFILRNFNILFDQEIKMLQLPALKKEEEEEVY